MDVSTALALIALALAVGIYGSIIGAGGGFLMVAALTLFFDLDGATATGTAVLATLFIQTTGAWTYDRQRLVDRPTAGWFAVGSVPVAFASGAFLANRIPARAFDLIVGTLLLGLALFVVAVRQPESTGDGDALAPRRGILAGTGSFVGLLSGALGVGAGLVTVPALGWIQRLAAHRAAATTTAIGAASGLAATFGHTIAGNPEWSFIPFLAIGAIVGGRLGASNASRLRASVVLGLLAIGLVVAGAPLIIRGI